MNLPHKFIAIEGNIGSGKTSLANYLVSLTNASFLPERFEANPFLSDFYKNKESFAFQTESFFLDDRAKQLNNYFSHSRGLTIADFSIYKSLIFSSINLASADFKKFKAKFDEVEPSVIMPDLIIYLNTYPAISLRQIHKRGRSYERNISVKYLERIEKAYAEFWSKSEKLNILHIPASFFHFPFNLKQMDEFLNFLIDTEIKGIKHLTPKFS